MKVYISHTARCSGWDMEKIYKGTEFRLACRTSRFMNAKDEDIQMLDWDFRKWKKDPEEIEKLHMDIVKEYRIETVMSMDLWRHNIEKALSYTDKLQKYANNVFIPVHYYCEELKGYDLAYPNANWFDGNVFPPPEYIPQIKHILGGSPHSQMKHLITRQTDIADTDKVHRFTEVESLDGNQIFNVAIRAGKEWFPTHPHWRKPKDHKTNEEIFRASVLRWDRTLKKLEKILS